MLNTGFLTILLLKKKCPMSYGGVASPNIADALALTEYFHTVAYRMWQTPAAQENKDRWANVYESEARAGRDSWQVH
jgi:hypothetical protein